MSAIIVAVKYSVKPGTRDEVLKFAAVNERETRKEKGCVTYSVYPSLENDQEIFVFETWETQEDLTAHTKTPHFLEFSEKRKPLLVEGSYDVKKYKAELIT